MLPLLLGLLFVALTVLMNVLARPTLDDEPVPFLRSWLLGQAYALTALASSIGVVAVTVNNWP